MVQALVELVVPMGNAVEVQALVEVGEQVHPRGIDFVAAQVEVEANLVVDSRDFEADSRDFEFYNLDQIYNFMKLSSLIPYVVVTRGTFRFGNDGNWGFGGGGWIGFHVCGGIGSGRGLKVYY